MFLGTLAVGAVVTAATWFSVSRFRFMASETWLAAEYVLINRLVRLDDLVKASVTSGSYTQLTLRDGHGGSIQIQTSATLPHRGRLHRSGRLGLQWIVGGVIPLMANGTLIFVTAGGGGYSPLGALYQMIVASLAALVGGFVLVLKPPAGRRLAALLLVTAYPLLLFGLILAGANQGVHVKWA